jgi:tripartite-type tricarboxylate transporter receptor subunit TctC
VLLQHLAGAATDRGGKTARPRRDLAQTRPAGTDLPTLHESSFPGFDVTSWFALLAPAGTPAPVIAKLHQETVRALAQPDVRRQFASMGMDVIANTPNELAAVIRGQIEDRRKLIEAAKIELQ